MKAYKSWGPRIAAWARDLQPHITGFFIGFIICLALGGLFVSRAFDCGIDGPTFWTAFQGIVIALAAIIALRQLSLTQSSDRIAHTLRLFDYFRSHVQDAHAQLSIGSSLQDSADRLGAENRRHVDNAAAGNATAAARAEAAAFLNRIRPVTNFFESAFFQYHGNIIDRYMYLGHLDRTTLYCFITVSQVVRDCERRLGADFGGFKAFATICRDHYLRRPGKRDPQIVNFPWDEFLLTGE
jgi:hypothetical protein